MNQALPGLALITGASGGIGEEFARILAAKGWNLVLVARSGDKLERLASELSSGGGSGRPIRVETISMDLSQAGAAAALHAETEKLRLSPDMVVNNAGKGLFGHHAGLPVSDVESMLELNVQSLTSLCALYGADMKARGQGRILNVGSFAGRQPTPYFAAYAASKSYVRAFTLALRAELKDSGVIVCCLEPGYVDTAFDANASISDNRYLAFSLSNALPARTVAQAGIDAVMKGKAFVIPGFKNRIAARFFALLPALAPPAIMKRFMDGLVAGSGTRT